MASSAVPDLGALVSCAPGIYGGRPCLADTRFPVLQLAVLHNGGLSPEEIAGRFQLSLAHVYAGIAYYLVNRDDIDADLAAGDLEYRTGLALQRDQSSKFST